MKKRDAQEFLRRCQLLNEARAIALLAGEQARRDVITAIAEQDQGAVAGLGLDVTDPETWLAGLAKAERHAASAACWWIFNQNSEV